MKPNRAKRRFEKAHRRKIAKKLRAREPTSRELTAAELYEERIATEEAIRAEARELDDHPKDANGYVDRYGILWIYDPKTDAFVVDGLSDPPTDEDKQVVEWADIARQVEAFSARVAKLTDAADPGEVAALNAEDERICALQRAHERKHHALH